jgi:hypothetical protein
MNVAVSGNMTGPNVESWVTAVKAKLAIIGFTTIHMVVAEINTINPKLARVRHVPMFTRALDLMA